MANINAKTNNKQQSMSLPQMTKEEMNTWRLNHMKEIQQNFLINQLSLNIDDANKSDYLKLLQITKDTTNYYGIDYLGGIKQTSPRRNYQIDNPIIIDLSDDEYE